VIETVAGVGPWKKGVSAVRLLPVTPFAQFAEPMPAVLADHRELTSSTSAFAAFQQGHFLPALPGATPVLYRTDLFPGEGSYKFVHLESATGLILATS
jgi:hypothetical protein